MEKKKSPTTSMICAQQSEQDSELAEIIGCPAIPSAAQPWRCDKRV